MEAELLFLLLAFFFPGGGGNDLLDYLPTDAYWKAKGAAPTVETMLAELNPPKDDAARDLPALIGDLGADDYAVREAATAKIRALGPAVIPQLKTAVETARDAEIRTRAEMLIGELSGAAKAADVRRLMAIRTLGELKKPEALEILRPLAASPDFFVADYAKAAIAAIEGKPYPRPVPTAEELASDVGLLPKSACGMAQVVLPAGGPVSFDAALKQMAGARGMRGGMGDPEKVKAQLAGAVLKLAERLGNVRVQALTGAFGGGFDRTAFGMVVARGVYEPAAVRAALVGLGCKAETRDGVDVVAPDGGEVTIALPSAQRLAFLGMDDRRAAAGRARDMIAALKAGKGTVSENQELSGLFKSLPAAAPVRAALVAHDGLRKEGPLLDGVDTVTLAGEVSKGGTDLTMVARGKDQEKLKASVAVFEQGRAEAEKEMKRWTEREAPFLKPITDLVTGLKVETKANEVTVRGRLEGQLSAGMIVLPFSWLMMMESESGAGGAVGPVGID